MKKRDSERTKGPEKGRRAEASAEERDRLGYERWPQHVEEAKRWEEIAAWPEDEPI